MAYIASKLAAAVDYAFYTKGANKINVVTDTIHVNGGADVINKRSLETPQGVVTEIDDEKLDKLKSHPVFKKHVADGFITILANEKDAKKAEKDLEKDKSRQLTPDDYEKKGKKKPTTKKG